MIVYLASAKCSIHSKLQRNLRTSVQAALAHDVLWPLFAQSKTVAIQALSVGALAIEDASFDLDKRFGFLRRKTTSYCP